jgi:hypothetical protein
LMIIVLLPAPKSTFDCWYSSMDFKRV